MKISSGIHGAHLPADRALEVPDSIVTGPYNISFDLGLPRDDEPCS